MNCGYCGGWTIEGESPVELAGKDFHRARWGQRFGRLVECLKGRVPENRLAYFSEERSRETVVDRRFLGIQAVQLAKVEGSVGRCWDFDRAFMPVCSCRGGRYFIEDGNHRVSVARYRGLPTIEAAVTELLTGLDAAVRASAAGEGEQW